VIVRILKAICMAFDIDKKSFYLVSIVLAHAAHICIESIAHGEWQLCLFE